MSNKWPEGFAVAINILILALTFVGIKYIKSISELTKTSSIFYYIILILQLASLIALVVYFFQDKTDINKEVSSSTDTVTYTDEEDMFKSGQYWAWLFTLISLVLSVIFFVFFLSKATGKDAVKSVLDFSNVTDIKGYSKTFDSIFMMNAVSASENITFVGWWQWVLLLINTIILFLSKEWKF
jgi:hypothetical protein